MNPIELFWNRLRKKEIFEFSKLIDHPGMKGKQRERIVGNLEKGCYNLEKVIFKFLILNH